MDLVGLKLDLRLDNKVNVYTVIENWMTFGGVL